MTTIYFDMDGTLANFYGVPNWLKYLIASDPTPYAIADPLLDMNLLANKLNALQRKGYRLGVISWLSKSGTPEYDAQVTEVKREWLDSHLPTVEWDEVHIVKYGTPKQMFANNETDILFDDEMPNRQNWTGQAFDAPEIFKVLLSM